MLSKPVKTSIPWFIKNSRNCSIGHIAAIGILLIQVLNLPFITSRVSGRGHRIGAVFLCVCVSVCVHSHG